MLGCSWKKKKTLEYAFKNQEFIFFCMSWTGMILVNVMLWKFETNCQNIFKHTFMKYLSSRKSTSSPRKKLILKIWSSNSNLKCFLRKGNKVIIYPGISVSWEAIPLFFLHLVISSGDIYFLNDFMNWYGK